MIAAMPVTVPTETITNMSPCVASSLNKFTTELRRLFLVEDMVDTIKFGLSLWLLTYIGSWFNMLTLLILAWITLFVSPKLYQQNKSQVRVGDSFFCSNGSHLAVGVSSIVVMTPMHGENPLKKQTNTIAI